MNFVNSSSWNKAFTSRFVGKNCYTKVLQIITMFHLSLVVQHLLLLCTIRQWAWKTAKLGFPCTEKTQIGHAKNNKLTSSNKLPMNNIQFNHGIWNFQCRYPSRLPALKVKVMSHIVTTSVSKHFPVTMSPEKGPVDIFIPVIPVSMPASFDIHETDENHIWNYLHHFFDIISKIFQVHTLFFLKNTTLFLK